MKLSILIPVYNEAPYFRSFWKQLRTAPLDQCAKITSCEILVVDDGSTDRTVEILRSLMEEPFHFQCGMEATVQLFLQEKNQGKGAAIRRAIDHSSGDVVLIQDADLEYSPCDYPVLLGPMLEDHADAVFGSRFVGHPRRALYFWHSLMNHFLTLLSNALFNINLTDMETGYKAMRGELARKLQLRSMRFGIEPELTAKLAKARARIFEVPVRYFGRTYAEGKKIRWTDGVAALYHIFYFGLLDREPFKPGLDQTLRSLDAVSKHIYEPALRTALEQIPDKGQLKILEIGAGVGSLTGVLLERGEVIATDIDPNYLARLEQRFRGREGFEARFWDATKVAPAEWPPFDVIVAFNVLEHIENDQEVVRAWGKLLRAGGSIILLVPNLPKLYSPIDRAVGHFRRYTQTDLKHAVASASLQPVKMFYCNAVGIVGWLINGVWLKRSAISSRQLYLYAILKPVISPIEKVLEKIVGLSIICIARGSATVEKQRA